MGPTRLREEISFKMKIALSQVSLSVGYELDKAAFKTHHGVRK